MTQGPETAYAVADSLPTAELQDALARLSDGQQALGVSMSTPNSATFPVHSSPHQHPLSGGAAGAGGHSVPRSMSWSTVDSNVAGCWRRWCRDWSRWWQRLFTATVFACAWPNQPEVFFRRSRRCRHEPCSGTQYDIIYAFVELSDPGAQHGVTSLHAATPDGHQPSS